MTQQQRHETNQHAVRTVGFIVSLCWCSLCSGAFLSTVVRQKTRQTVRNSSPVRLYVTTKRHSIPPLTSPSRTLFFFNMMLSPQMQTVTGVRYCLLWKLSLEPPPPPPSSPPLSLSIQLVRTTWRPPFGCFAPNINCVLRIGWSAGVTGSLEASIDVSFLIMLTVSLRRSVHKHTSGARPVSCEFRSRFPLLLSAGLSGKHCSPYRRRPDPIDLWAENVLGNLTNQQ